ncbi:transcription elongation factor spt5 [Kalmusia sp. IMI 367209]|nr:transcription elongation factor spt5 [Kalmusia sp. IMI 367209]
MRAITVDDFVTDLLDLKVRDNIPTPKPQKANDILVKVTDVGVTHVDTLYVQVKPPALTLGTEFAGTVVTSSSSELKAGDRVYGGGLGSYAEYICVDASNVRKVPSQWTNAEACAVSNSGPVSYGALVSMGGLVAGETVLILGASGGLGVMAIQIAKAIGAKVIALVGNGEKARMVLELGADAAVDYHEVRWEDRVRALTDDGEGVHLVYDAIGAVESGLKCLRYRGRLVIVGFAARGGVMEKVAMNRILLKSATVHGYRYGEDGRRDPKRTEEVWNGFMKLVSQGAIKPVTFSKGGYQGLSSIPRALEDVKENKTWGRVVVEEIDVDDSRKAKL